MPSTLPDGDPAPADGSLPPSALTDLAERSLGAYLHVPFCAVRCGYCDFNTYTATELGGGASQASYASTAVREVELLAGVLPGAPAVSTVFFGGGTPTLLPSADLVAMLGAVRERFGLAPGAEVTTEANPDSVTPESLAELRAGGFTRVSFGMQSAVPSVLAVLDRTHDPERVPQAVAWARDAGFEQVSLDLIYGTPGESVADWETSVRAALACEPDHVSAYSLIVEDGTAFARKVRTGVVPLPDEDDLADKYEVVDDLLTASGLDWYEVSNWARGGQSRCRHNELYWTSQNWLGVGPGAHAHVGGVRWWNAKHPTAYAARLEAGESPALAREVLDAETRRVERVLLEVRLRDGLDLALVDPARVGSVVAAGLADVTGGRLVLTRRGRLLADAVVRDLVG
ncbi:MAG: radical SAM family heme chaperone HemW [Propionibacteriales bacterium]|nr:radical SAM family heme chaperone HemW [Propionibacteriales bacterium]